MCTPSLEPTLGHMMDEATPVYETPTAIDLSRSDITAIADNVRRKVGYGPGEALELVVVKLGGEICNVEGAESIGAIVVEPGRFRICIPRGASSLGDRFFIARELGHYVLHYLYQNQRNRRNIKYLKTHRHGADQAELEANWFAAAFLMPADVFREKYREHEKNLFELADYFGVSHQVVMTRAESLNLRV